MRFSCTVCSARSARDVGSGSFLTGTYMARANDGSIPIAHHDILAILQAIRARAIADTFLALLEFFKEAEISRNWIHLY